MKSLSRVTNSRVITGALLAVIIGSLCFSVGEGLRLTPFPVTTLSQTEGSNTAINVYETAPSLSKYGPLDVPSQKRSKRSSIDFASGSSAGRELVSIAVVGVFDYEAEDLKYLPHIAHPSGRAPPLNS
jgi:hypothetical protein